MVDEPATKEAASEELARNEVAEIAADVLPHFDGWEGAAIARLGGRPHQPQLPADARATAARAVLQAVNPIFPPEIHGNIVAVTERLAAAGHGDAAPACRRATGGPT